MLNTTILSLTIASFSSSPFIIPSSNFRISKSTFSNLFNHPIYSNRFLNSFLCEKTKFNKIIGSGIYLNFGSNDYENQVFKETLVVTSVSSRIQVTQCLFTECSSQFDGGGIRMTANNANILIQLTGFKNCESKRTGGAFYINSKKFALERCCLASCSAKDSAAFYFSNIYESADEFKETYIYDMADSSTNMISIDSHEPNIQNSNISYCREPSIHSILEFKSFEGFTFRYTLFLKCKSTNLVYFDDISDDTSIQLSNFDSNKASDAVFHISNYKTLKVIKCSFMKDDSDKYTSRYSWFESCIFDHPKDSGKFPFKDYETDCKYDSSYTTYNINIPSEKENNCWNLITKVVSSNPGPSVTDEPPLEPTKEPSASTGSKIKTALFTIFGAVLVIAAIVVGYMVYKLWRNRQAESKALLMYTQV